MPEPSLKSILIRSARRLAAVETAAGSVWGLVAAAIALLLAAWLDLLWELSSSARMATWIVGGSIAAIVLAVRVCLLIRSARFSAIARRLDRAATSSGAIVSGWELFAASRSRGDTPQHATDADQSKGQHASPASDTSVTAPSAGDRDLITAGLASMAVEHAAKLAGSVPGSAAVPLRPIGRACVVGVALAVVIGATTLCLPALSRTQWLRFTQPWADIPPYSRLTFEVKPGHARVVYASAMNVQVKVSGGSPERIELVYSSGGGEEVLPMFPEAGSTYRATLARVEEPGRYFIRAERARSKRYRIEVITVPRIQSVRFRIRPPAYTRDAEYRGPLPKNGIAALVGTRIEVQVASNRPLSGGEIVLTEARQSRTVPLRPTGKASSAALGDFEVTSAGRFELRLVDTKGQKSRETFAGSITLLRDQRPFVRLLEPPGISLATPGSTLPVTLSAEDDYGVRQAELYRSLNNSRPLPMSLPVNSPPPRLVQERTYLPLNEYGLTPGDEIKMFARVEDNDPAGGKGSESSVVTVRIISQEEFDRMVRMRQGVESLLSKYQQVQRRLESLAQKIDEAQKELDAAPPDSPLAQATQEKLKRLADEMRAQAKALDELGKDSLPFDADRKLSGQLQPLAQMLQEAARELEPSGSSPSSTNSGASEKLRQLAKRLQGGRDQYQQQAIEPLEHLRLVYPLMEDQQRFLMLATRQRDLAQRMSALKGRGGEDDPALRVRMRELEDQQRKVRTELLELLDDIEEHAGVLPDQPEYRKLRSTADAFVAAVRASPAAQLMSGAETALAEFSGTAAAEQSAKAADVLESFISKCEGMGGEGKACLAFNPSWSQSLGNTVDQLLAEAGLNNGGTFGQAAGAGGGYSTMRSSLNNVGLYGALPTAGPSGGEGRGQPGLVGTGANGQLATGSGGALPRSPLAEQGSASGVSQGSIPPRYRQRVGQYFERIADESKN